MLDEKTYVLGFSRSAMTDEAYRAECRESVVSFGRSKPIDEGVWKKLEGRLHYAQADYGSEEDHARVKGLLVDLDKKHGAPGNRLFYLATPPSTFEPVIQRLGEQPVAFSGPMGSARRQAWQRIIIEKPFGYDTCECERVELTVAQNIFPRIRFSGSITFLGKRRFRI